MILSAKYELMRKNFRNFAETEFTTEIQEKLDKEGGFDTEMYKKMAKYGFPGIKIPVKYGGQGGDSLAYVLMNEEFARGIAVGRHHNGTGRRCRDRRTGGCRNIDTLMVAGCSLGR